jgi:hypothetical protein
MTLDEKALDVATEALRPLFREPVSYLEQAAREVIAAYLTAAVTARVEALEAALTPFADAADGIPADAIDAKPACHVCADAKSLGSITTLHVRAFRNARAALSPDAP